MNIPRDKGPSHVGGSRNADGVTLYYAGDECDDIKAAAEALMPRWRESRRGFLKWLGDLKWALVGEFVNGKWVRKLPNGGVLAGQLGELTYDHMQVNTQMKILAGLWVARYCGTEVWPTSYSGGGGGWGDYTLVCDYEMWEISFDGGATWHPVEVRVCDYQWVYHVTLAPRGSFLPADPLLRRPTGGLAV